MSLSRSLALGCLVLAAGCRASVTPAPVPAESGAYVVTLGNDTLSAESYSRVGNRIEGMVVRRVPRTVITRYVLTLNASGLPAQIESNTRVPDGSMLPNGARSITVRYTPDSAITTIQRDTAETRRIALRNAYPEIDGIVSLYAVPIGALDRMHRDSAMFVSYVAGNTGASSTPVARRAPYRYWLYSFDSPIEVTIDPRGNVVSVDASRTTFRIQSRRQSGVDVPALAAAFARREAATGPMVALSLRDSMTVTVGNARVFIDYGRPAARGRKVFGANGVLGDTLWRTGANAATQFRTDAVLTIGGRTLPAGAYSLTTLAIPGRYQLIFTERKQDGVEVLRVPLQATAIAPLVERFTIAVEPLAERAAVLRLRWDTTELSVPFSVP